MTGSAIAVNEMFVDYSAILLKGVSAVQVFQDDSFVCGEFYDILKVNTAFAKFVLQVLPAN